MFTVDYKLGFYATPQLLSDDSLVPDSDIKLLKARTIREDEHSRLYLADNLGTIVEFGCIEKPSGKWWSSRPGCFNTISGGVAIIRVVAGCRAQHYDYYFVRRKIDECGQDIRFFKIEQFDNHEVYYVPYEPQTRDLVFNKLYNMHGISDIVDLD